MSKSFIDQLLSFYEPEDLVRILEVSVEDIVKAFPHKLEEHKGKITTELEEE